MVTRCRSVDPGTLRSGAGRSDDRRGNDGPVDRGRRTGAASSRLRRGLLALVTLAAVTAMPVVARAEQFLGDFGVFAFNFCPRGWAPANGALLSIQQNQALFSLVGLNYGGNGSTTFGLPKMSAMSAAHDGVPATVMTVCIAVTGVYPTRP